MIERISALAKLYLTEEEKKQLQQDLEQVLQSMALLQDAEAEITTATDAETETKIKQQAVQP